MIRRLLAIAAAGLLLAAFGQATVGTPIVGIPIGLEGDPDPIVASGRTDPRGEAVFSVGPGRYSVFLTNPSAPAVITVTPVNDAPSMTSAPIRPGRGRVYAVDAAGRRLVTTVPRGGGRVRVTLTEAGSRTTVTSVSTGGQSGSETGDARATVNPSGGPIDIEAWSWGRIDRENTAEACTARRGVVLMHESIQQCRLPATARREASGSAQGTVSTPR
ncbi:hypothetical protein [Brevundimonas sp.]|uniref:hypothetical protein n=1 Tax=Brevundimonas sp. TaxID=1871086 RepID=UPI002737CBBE|nr:hypothetical protein [Brevundimonas sp.]MDP3801225.1 hypothetical protein [Brevundimonas sp.]